MSGAAGASRPDPAELLDLAVDIAQRTGRLLVDERPDGALDMGTKSSPTDIVTTMDTAAERLIADAVREARPDDGMLGEEGMDTTGSSGVRWVVDPIDGTVNYLYRYPAWAVSIAAEVDGKVVAGVVHAPALGETWTAILGGGARLGGRVLRVGEPRELGQSLIATGFGYSAADRAWQAEIVSAVLPRVRDIRRGGSAAIDLCSVATGRVDGYYERGCNPWDLAAGALVAREAGAIVGGSNGAPAGYDLVLAAPPTLFAALHDLVASRFDALDPKDG
ncbi:inositol monophosphatase family protein [soil metagenome]